MGKNTQNILYALGTAVLVAAIALFFRFVVWGEPEVAPAPQKAAEEAAPSEKTPSVLQQSHEDFSKFMISYLPRTMCQKDRFFRKCYLVTREICLETARKVTEECLRSQAPKMGKVIKAGVDVEYWQTMTGRCAGGFYNRDLADHLKEEDHCLR